MQLTPAAKRAIDLAYEQARGMGNDYIGSHHLLFGLIAEAEGLAAQVLLRHGVDMDTARRHIEARQAAES
jgi:ATP-dependent Clp protease ATP-binding subunit ClpC